ncbi:MAG: hypothetical protein AAGK47_00100 [Bacteroidota bacterium]
MQQGFLLIIDGASAVGKTTITNALLAQEAFPLAISRRVTTRARRANDDPNYDFINHDQFDQLVTSGALLEHHNYLFGMSYGLPKADVMQQLQAGKYLLGMINLGNFATVQAQVPNSFGVFLNASIPTIQRRLEARKSHTAEQIEERLGNAQRAKQYMADYNLVIKNEDRSVDSVTSEIISSFRDFIQQRSPL